MTKLDSTSQNNIKPFEPAKSCILKPKYNSCASHRTVVKSKSDQGYSPKHEHKGYSSGSEIISAHADQQAIEKQERRRTDVKAYGHCRSKQEKEER